MVKYNKEVEIQDIEDLVSPHLNSKDEDSKSSSYKCPCPYFQQRKRSEYADLVIMPYNYLIDTGIRANMEISFKDTVVIIDEAHNIDSVWEDLASTEITESKLVMASIEVEGLGSKILQSKSNPEEFPLFKSSVENWMKVREIIKKIERFVKRNSLKHKDWKMFSKTNGQSHIAKVTQVITLNLLLLGFPVSWSCNWRKYWTDQNRTVLWRNQK